MSLLRSLIHRRSITTTLIGSPHDLLAASQLILSPSPLASPALASTPECEENEKDGDYFERRLTYSPAPDSSSESDSEGEDSDATLEDDEVFAKIGHPLQRVSRHKAPTTPGSDPRFGHGSIYHPGAACSSSCTSRSQSLSSVTSSLTDYQTIVDELLKGNPFDQLDPQNFVTYDPILSASFSSPPVGPALMIKRILRDSTELSLLLELNSSGSRKDPWNPSPHILQVIDHDPKSDHLYLCMERLNEYNAPPMSTVAQYLDFFHQILEGLSFLHEHRIVGMACSDPSSYMVDLSSGPHSSNESSVSLLSSIMSQGLRLPTPLRACVEQPDYFQPHHYQSQQQYPTTPLGIRTFDRSTYPVKYYFVNFSHARHIQAKLPALDRIPSTPSPSSSSAPRLKLPLPPKQLCPFKQDVQELGTLIDRMLADVPKVVGAKFKTLIKAMTVGGFGAEDSRKLFEALCRSLEASVFETPVNCGSREKSVSADIVVNGGGGSSCASSMKGDFGFGPETVALSS